MAIVYNQIILTGFVPDDPLTVELHGRYCTFFEVKVKHQCFTESSSQEGEVKSHLVLSSGERVRGYAEKVSKGNRVKVKGYLATQKIQDSDNSELLIVAQKIVFL